MFQIISEPDSNVLAIRINAEVTKEDYDLALPRLRDKIKSEGKLNLYCEIDNVASITPGAIWEDLKFDIRHLRSFNRVAIIGDKVWEKWMTKFGALFTTANVRFYNPQEKADAMEWVSNPHVH
jgi:hypothetical protein